MEKFFKYPKVIVGVIALITVFFALQLPRTELDNNNYRFLPATHQSRIISDRFEETFGNSAAIMVGLERPVGSVFDPVFLTRIRDYISTIQSFEFIDDVSSIMTTDYITAEGDTIVVTDLVGEDFSGTAEEIAALQQRIASWDLYQGSLVSDDLSSTQILIPIDVPQADAGKPEVIATLFKVRDTAHEMFDGFATVYITGDPVISATISEAMNDDIVLLIPLVVIVLLGVLFFAFHRASGIILPTLTVLIATIWSVGVMPFLGIKLSILSMIVPVLLVAVGSAYGIHIVTHYYEETGKRKLTAEKHRQIVFDLVRRLFKPVFLAALTTLAGFISFCFTPVVPMFEFGVVTSLGVFAAFIVAVTLIPACFLIRGPKELKTKHKNEKQRRDWDAAIEQGFFSLVMRRRLVLVCTILLTVIALYGSSKLIIDNVLVEFFDDNTDIVKSDRFIREKFGGSKSISMVLEADSTEALLDPKVLGAMDDLSTILMEREPLVGKAAGFSDMVKRINQVFNADESPDRIAANYSTIIRDEEGDSFGFDSFGFDESEPVGDPLTDPVFSDGNADLLTAQLSSADLIALLDSAAGTKVNMNANDLVRELKRRTNYEGMAYYEIPRDPEKYGKTTDAELEGLIANYLVLLSGDNTDYSNDPIEPTAIKSTIQMRTTGCKDTVQVIDTINAYASKLFPDTIRFILGGGSALEVAITDLVVDSQMITIGISILMVFIIIALSNKSLAAGLIGSLSIIIAVLCNFAIMGFLGIKLNIGTAIIASLIVGIGIDYTIHFMDSFKREYLAGNKDTDANAFLHRTFKSSGKAIIVNALSVGGGFAVLAFSRFRIIADLGLLVALAMIITAFLSLTVIPALLVTIKPKFIYGKKIIASYEG
ncbi:putative membrane protein [Treponema primitia ZAS-2]|uniref:Putative membrane protein n=1 Tax=Treponema primitia (strain ATCC BAA-887 / DSM 12427 / ZAS-2) TaxID=545694 RepID=F5YPW4_TREPZ|nr:MMPL family transporter [Treponema primitia]AEF84682.1 putative membrane protein [Treponema primitia ZAS-2]